MLDDPLSLVKFWEAGRSFHAGLLGVMFAIYIYAKRHRCRFWAIGDYIVPAIPIGLGFGRIGNFLNAELWGRVTTLPWGVVFPDAGPYPRHPSQLYEFVGEGIILFLLLHFYSNYMYSQNQQQKLAKPGAISGLFLLGYGVIRIIIEFYREPDLDVGFLFGQWLTMGQLLSVPMILVGIWLIKRSSSCNNI
jgi:phosphatidylglycerol:prolipoprotein diacylglycerol transferase